MGIFSKNKKDDEFFQLIDFEDGEQSDDNIRAEGGHETHALTPDEILFGTDDTSDTENVASNPLNTLKKRMQQQSENPVAYAQSEEDEPEPEFIPPKPHEHVFATKPDKGISLDELINKSEDISRAAKQTAENTVSEEKAPSEPAEKSLLEKCMPYIVDDKGNTTITEKPSYKLESVADILKTDSMKTIEMLSKKYEITVDDLGRYGIRNENKPEPVKDDDDDESYDNVYEDLVDFSEKKSDLPDISDIDNAVLPKAEIKATNIPQDTGTIRFTPVKDDEFDTSHISISSQTRAIDLTGELTELSDKADTDEITETELELSEFEEYVPDEEYRSQADTKDFIKKFSIKKRSSFLKLASSLISLLLLALFRLPVLYSFLVSNTTVCMIICSVLLAVILGVNCDIFLSFTKMFTRKATPDSGAALASVAVASYIAYGISKNEITLDIMLLLGVILTVRAAAKFMKDAYMLSNFRQISSSSQKRAIKLIDDNAVTFLMAKNAVEGDVLVAAPQKTEFVNDYMKYSTFGTFLSGRLPIITAVSLIIAIITGFACAAYYNGVLYGFYSAAALLCIASLPGMFFIDSLPLYSAAKHLNRHGAMIAGKAGAERIEAANAVVLNSEDLFPNGTITLHNMKVLSENSIDDTIIRAASLTEALGSPLTSIFKKIAGNSNVTALPDSDTVKYEDRMGISGWVDDKLLFIGNRTLLESHGISVPDVSIDKKILRQGYFPVYLASDNKACALIVVQYSVNPEIAHQLRKITALGVTVLVDNTDPNLSEEMICDYLGLYDDSVKVMSSAGSHMCHNATGHIKAVSAPAAYKSSPIGFATLINCVTKIKRSNILLSVFYIISAILGVVTFIYTSFAGSGSILSGAVVLLYGIICTAISYILYLTEKP